MEPIQDKSGNLTVMLGSKTYTINVNSEEEREELATVMSNLTNRVHKWFKEETGKKYWVLYDTNMYEIKSDTCSYLHYREDRTLAPTIPLNATSCYYMFSDCKSLLTIYFADFNTDNISNMFGMFSGCTSMISLDLSHFRTPNVKIMDAMFYNCTSLLWPVFTNFNTENVISMPCMFCNCRSLQKLDLTGFNIDKVMDLQYFLGDCFSLESVIVDNVNLRNFIMDDYPQYTVIMKDFSIALKS